jgi:hypothetical protein
MVELASKATVLSQLAVNLLNSTAVGWVLQVVEGLEHSASDFRPQPGLLTAKYVQCKDCRQTLALGVSKKLVHVPNTRDSLQLCRHVAKCSA